jgi:acyl-coenzyme A thioesterase PaaI-like protein
MNQWINPLYPLGFPLIHPLMELPHTPGCVVCGRANPHGLKLSLHVDPETGIVTTEFTPRAQHVGFEGIVHGGVLSTVLDEAMVWAATWAGRRFCVAAEMTVRFKKIATLDVPLRVAARVTESRGKLVQTAGELADGDSLVATATGKYVRMSEADHRKFCDTFVDEPQTVAAADSLRHAV